MIISRSTATALSIAALGAVLALGAPSSAVAASASTISFAPESGRWSDPAALMTTDFSCLPGSQDDLPRVSGFLAEPGNETPAVDADTAVIPSVYPYTKPNGDLSQGLTDVATGADGKLPADLRLDMFMPGTWFYGTDFSEVTDMGTELAPNHTYSFGLFCYSDATGAYQRDADGRVHSAWIPLYTGADGSWSFVEGGTPVEQAATAVDLTASLADDQATVDATATVRAINGANTLSDATGTVTFREGATVVGTASTKDGVAQTSFTGLPAGDHRFTASYTPDAAASGRYKASSASAESPAVTIPKDGDTPDVPGAELNPGDTVTAGSAYKVTVTAGSFTAGDTLSGTVTPDGTSLDETAVVAADGSAVYGFTAPSGFAAGSHQLVIADEHSISVTVAFTVPTESTPSASPSPSASASAAAVPPGTTASPSPNAAVAFATGWVGGMASTPLGAATLFGTLLMTTAAVVAGWVFFWRRRSATATIRGDQE